MLPQATVFAGGAAPPAVAAAPSQLAGAVSRPSRCLVVGMLRVTPDSFSDSGKAFRPERAIARGTELHAAGADIVDVGGESAHPGAARVPLAEEIRRIVPVVRELAAAGLFVSVDTMRARAAEAAVAAGARMINDLSGGLADPAMLPLAAECQAHYVIVSWRGRGPAMRARECHSDVVTEVAAGLAERMAAAADAGVAASRLIIDPGLGPARADEDNWRILASLGKFRQLGPRLLIGASRQPFLGRLLRGPGGERPAAQRDAATAAITALAAVAGAWAVRVHDVRSSSDAVRVAAEIGAGPAPPGLPDVVHVQ